MAIDLKNADHRAKLQKGIKRSFEKGACEREKRADLKRIYQDKPTLSDLYLNDKNKQAYLNLFALFVRGHCINLAYRAPRFSINARSVQGKGFDKQAQLFLDHYTCILNFASLVERWAVDSAFGRAVAKVCTSIAPKGIVSATAPRCFRLNPDLFIPDRSANHPDEMMYACDVYFVDLDEARAHEHFPKERREKLSPWTSYGSTAFMGDNADVNLFSQEQTRLIDVYIPTLGKLCTWECSSDSFSEIAASEPLQELKTAINPYPQLNLEFTPDSLDEISRLGQLRPLNMLANDLYTKIANQARMSQRNPIAQVGDEDEMNALLSRPDSEPGFLNNTKAVDVFVLPGPDAQVAALANDAANKFSQNAGNLGTALGISPGAPTARQTQALIGQINEAGQVDQMKFERFLGEIGKCILTLAFEDEALQLSYAQKIPGTKIWGNAGWGKPYARVGEIDDYIVETIPYSTKFRGPQERLQQLNSASQMVFGVMQQAAMGAPLNIEAVIEDCAESFDLIPRLAEWWSGAQPTPAEKAGQVYRSMAGPSQGSDINYNSNAGGGGGQEMAAPQQAGLASSGTMVQ